MTRYFFIPPNAAADFAACFPEVKRTEIDTERVDGGIKVKVTTHYTRPDVEHHAAEAVRKGLIMLTDEEKGGPE